MYGNIRLSDIPPIFLKTILTNHPPIIHYKLVLSLETSNVLVRTLLLSKELHCQRR